jgi:hypothetical protein
MIPAVARRPPIAPVQSILPIGIGIRLYYRAQIYTDVRLRFSIAHTAMGNAIQFNGFLNLQS